MTSAPRWHSDALPRARAGQRDEEEARKETHGHMGARRAAWRRISSNAGRAEMVTRGFRDGAR